MAGVPPAQRGRDVEPHAALGGEFERVRQQILEHLLQTLGVGHDAASQIRIEVHLERKLPIFRFVAERARNHVDQVGEVDLLGIHSDGSGLDFG